MIFSRRPGRPELSASALLRLYRNEKRRVRGSGRGVLMFFWPSLRPCRRRCTATTRAGSLRRVGGRRLALLRRFHEAAVVAATHVEEVRRLSAQRIRALLGAGLRPWLGPGFRAGLGLRFRLRLGLFGRLLLLGLGRGRRVVVTVRALAVAVRAFLVALRLTLAVLALLLLAPLVDLALRLGEHTHVMLGVLLEVLGRHAVVSEPGVTRQLVIFVDDLLRRTAHLALGATAVEHTVDDIAQRVAVAVVLRPRTGFRGSH